MSDIDTAAVDSLKVLDPKRPIREVTLFVPGFGEGVADPGGGYLRQIRVFLEPFKASLSYFHGIQPPIVHVAVSEDTLVEVPVTEGSARLPPVFLRCLSVSAQIARSSRPCSSHISSAKS